jgi:NADH-quinone oxidoreductase subunit M
MADNPEAGLQPLQWAAILCLWGVVISAVYMLRAYRLVFKGPLPEGAAGSGISDLTWAERIPALLLLVALIATGFVPSILLKYLTPTLEGHAALLGGG